MRTVTNGTTENLKVLWGLLVLDNLAGLVLKLQGIIPESSRENWPGWGFVESVIMFVLRESPNDFLHCPYHQPPGSFDLSPWIWQTRGCLQSPVQPFHYMRPPPEIWRCWPPPQLCRCWRGVGGCAASSWRQWSIPCLLDIQDQIVLTAPVHQSLYLLSL